ncbi:DNA-directed RNA polymerase sigma-70 factor [Longispora fulva]|uniref:RNA polymerase sigma factor n=1 Tax=Longispora fulva TaxID=619741 RepID=A0A8J7GW06_9ACTN|nr:RNA polymerase sigma factor [Longispora fulva]MBG6139649.1 RNA polymerase sigma-70 factor (ECF subfamily) [Longispora fulva]GIG57969.1 DNA-directed RNA polymerase sigma-70 factor [Longispora fulva]
MTGTTTDRELWDEALAGSPAAFGLLFDRHARAVYNHCFRLTASWSEAEDLTQVTFLTAWRRRAQIRLERDSALPWLLTVATNVARTHARSLRRRFALLTRATGRHDDLRAADHAEEVAERVDAERRMAALLGDVGRLPRAEREAFALVVLSQVSYADAAGALGIAEASVRSRVSRARGRLTRLTVPTDASREQ